MRKRRVADVEDRKVLLRIRNLKQYFPLKSKQVVKANDDITLDIYEGETLGLVGESGCGKSTLGRTVLQLYHQTDGKTMYYGRELDYIAPKYVRETLERLPRLRRELTELQERQARIDREYDELLGWDGGDASAKEEIPEDHPNAKKLFEKRNELDNAKRDAHEAFLNIAQLIGGFIITDDMSESKRDVPERTPDNRGKMSAPGRDGADRARAPGVERRFKSVRGTESPLPQSKRRSTSLRRRSQQSKRR